MANPDKAVEKALHEMNNASKTNHEKEDQFYKALAEYWEKKYLTIYPEYEKLAAMHGITTRDS